MKSGLALILALTSIPFVPIMARAGDQPPDPARISRLACQDPVRFVCQDSPRLDARAAKLLEPLIAPASERAAQAVGIDPSAWTQEGLFGEASIRSMIDPAVAQNFLVPYFTYLENAIVPRALFRDRDGKVNRGRAALRAFTEKVQDGLMLTVNSRKDLSRVDKVNALKKIASLEILTPMDFASKAESIPSFIDGEAFFGITTVCGFDGQSLNGFSASKAGGVVLCPGALALLIDVGLDSGLALGMASHEAGHILDEDGSHILGFAPAGSHSGPRLREWSADSWQNDALAFQLNLLTEGQPREDFVRQAYSMYCNEPDDFWHPLGNDRIQWALEHPKIRQSLGCAQGN